MIDTVYRHCGQKETVIFCDRIMSLGFGHACRAGISFGKDDMLIPDSKAKLVADTETLTKEYEQQYNDGLITQGEKYNKVVDAWAKCSEKVADEMMARIKAVEFLDNGRQKPMNSIYMMSHSGARGSPTQMRQLAGMRGLMARPDGSIIETPIIVPSQDIVLGLYYLSLMQENEPGEGMAFASIGELHHALETGAVTLHTKIKGRFKSIDADGNETSHIYDTTPGRMLIGELLPKNPDVTYDACNRLMTKKEISRMIDTVYRHS
jgi:DNA-directed RNA polymerase beta' subunit